MGACPAFRSLDSIVGDEGSARQWLNSENRALKGRPIELIRHPPFDVHAGAWTHPTDHAAYQAMARLARQADPGAIVYRSVRDPKPAWCMAVLTPAAFARPRPPCPARQSWWLAVRRDEVIWRRENDAHSITMSNWI